MSHPELLLTQQLTDAGHPPTTEHKFHPTRKWRLDLAYPQQKLAIEIHGATHTRGRHTRGQGFANDREKINTAQLMGWTVLEFPSDLVMQTTIPLDTIIKELKRRDT